MTLRDLREAANLSQDDLALLAGVEQATISQIETGKSRHVRWSTVAGLARALDTTPEAVAEAIANTTEAA